MIKNLPAKTPTLGSIPGLGRSPEVGNDNPLQYLAWEIPWAEEPSRLQFMGLQELDMTWQHNHRHMYRLHTAPS